MIQATVHFLPDDLRVSVRPGCTIAQAAQEAQIFLSLPCGGRGACGRCTVLVDGQPVSACVTPVTDNMTVTVPDTVRLAGQAVLTDIRSYDVTKNRAPRVRQVRLSMEAPTLDDSINDASRVTMALARQLDIRQESLRIEPAALVTLPRSLRDGDFNITANVFYESDRVTVLSFSERPIYGIAIDIGTTTVVTALCDLSTGLVLDTVGQSNPQAEYGADVISRVVYTEEHEGGAKELQDMITGALRESIVNLTERAGIMGSDILVAVVAGNTVMTHFFLNLPTDYLRREPYVPVACEFPPILPGELNLPMLPHGRVVILPAVSSYVGGDITAGVIALDLSSRPGLNLFVDVGTNGEMVLAGTGFMMACSCSAGPAFEGSGISHGSRAVRGAIDNVTCDNGQITYDVIGGPGAEAKSLCGSGLISLLSALLQKGVIDRSGRFTTEEKEFFIAPGVSMTQDDVFNLIRAKAAIYAGMRVLVKNMDMKLSGIDNIFVSGGFGRSLNIGGATNIGMLPPLPMSSFSYEGNTSLAGALRVLNDRTITPEATSGAIVNLELSVGNQFMEEFTMASFLPHTELDFFGGV
ncbi:ferredoxin [Synergistales bacterium]|nr:ferredoxin [Synergistales bacterium]